MTAVAAAIADLSAGLRGNDRARVNAAARVLLDHRAALGAQWRTIAAALLRSGEIALAMEASDRDVAESDGAGSAQFARAVLLAQAGRQREAADLASAAPLPGIAPAQRDHFLGTCLMEAGELERAQALFLAALKRAPHSGASWLALASLGIGEPQVLLRQLESARGALDRAPPLERAQAGYARAALLARAGAAPEDVFAAVSAGAQVAAQLRRHDGAADAARAAALRHAWSPNMLGELAAAVEPSTGDPIFVTGIPRSGTTLVAQMLGSHPAVAGGGELPFVPLLVAEAGGAGPENLRAYADRHGGLAPLSQLYRHLIAQRFGEDARIVDKTLTASRLMGVIATVFPRARIVWLRRDPLDCAWSCFRTYFTSGIDWSWSLADIAQHMKAEDALYHHWQSVLGDRLLSVPYEALVADPRGWADRILDHVGLDRDPAVYTPHEARRSVTTASVAQVRKPVYRDAAGSAGPYRRHLQPFLDAYAG